MAIEKKLICFARLEEFERQLAAGNILDYSIVFIQDAKKIWNRGTYYDCSTLTESTISEWGFTKNTGTYSKPNGGIPKSDLASAVQTSLGKADTALQSYTEQYKGTVTGVKMNGASKGTSGVVDLGNVVTSVKINGLGKTPSNGVVDLGTVITEHQDISGKQDALVSGTNIKTINGTSILGSGDITIEGGSGSVTDVKVEGTSVVNNGVATIRKATVALYGVTKISTSLSSTSNETVPTSGTIKKVYDLANGKQDALVSGTNIKTINGESILGSGDISISGGSGGEDIRYFTEFTVEQILESTAGGVMTADNSELRTAIQNNKLVCIPYKDNANGFVVASYDESHIYFLNEKVLYKLVIPSSGIIIEPIYLRHNTVYSNNTTPWAEQVYDNSTHIESNPATGTLKIIIVEDLLIGSTIRFTTGEDCSLQISGRGADNLLWANGVMPTIEPRVTYELSLRTDYTDKRRAYAVLTPFKPVE